MDQPISWQEVLRGLVEALVTASVYRLQETASLPKGSGCTCLLEGVLQCELDMTSTDAGSR